MPDDMDEHYVLNYQINIDDNDEENDLFRFILTTLRLQYIATKSNLAMTDATYKLNWHGFPVILIGVVDLDKKFHPTGLSICKSESTDDYKFIFESIKKTMSHKYLLLIVLMQLLMLLT